MDRAHACAAQAKMWCDENMQTRAQERRKSRRLKMGQPLKVIATDPGGGMREDSGTTRNVSRDGFYFISKKKGYREGMRLYVTLPFHAPGDLRNHEYLGQVIRVDTLENGEWGVAIQLLSGRSAGEGKR